MPLDARNLLVRFLTVTAGAGTALAMSVLILIPALRPLASAAALGPSPAAKFKPLATRSIVYARDGTTVLAVLHADENRELTQLSRIPKVLVNAIVDTEDRRFYQHGGVDLGSMFRAAVVNSREGRITQGGSTITQQLVKNELLTSKRNVGRKIQEAALAIRLEGEMTKDQILERYLNTIYFGEGAYGVRAAIERFFGKQDMNEITAPEAALLAGMIRDPLGYNPFLHPEASRARRGVVLRKMLAAHHLQPEEAKAAASEPLPTQPQNVAPEPKDYFVEEVKRRLLTDARLGSTYQQRYNRLFRGGLRITTTLDANMQSAAQDAVDKNLPESPFTAALVSMDPKNGEVRALVGGPNFDKAKFNLATQGTRQPGSSFKAITLAAALENGYSPNDTLDATAPCSFMKPGWLKPWTVNNYEPGEGGVVSLTDATVHSLNCAYANLVLDLEPKKVVDMAHKLGIPEQRKLDAFPSITLGSEEVTPLDMATVFSTFAAEGTRHDPVFVTKVQRSDGHLLFDNHSEGKPVLEVNAARTETAVLQQVIQRGTGTRAAIGRPAAGKTGTAEDWHDAWFCGFTPQLATVVWMGHPGGQIPMYNVGGVRVVGGTYPAQIWSAYMRAALADAPVLGFTPPDMSGFGSTFIGEAAPTTTSVVDESTTMINPLAPIPPISLPSQLQPYLPPRFQQSPGNQQPQPFTTRGKASDCMPSDLDC